MPAFSYFAWGRYEVVSIGFKYMLHVSRPASAGPPKGGRSSSSGWTERDSKPTVPADLDW
jgi:hypothetical protein